MTPPADSILCKISLNSFKCGVASTTGAINPWAHSARTAAREMGWPIRMSSFGFCKVRLVMSFANSSRANREPITTSASKKYSTVMPCSSKCLS